MATLVFVHAHPDDEASQTSGTMARAVAAGDRVVCVYATNGDHGSAPDDLGDHALADRRRAEAEASAEAVGTHRIVWLGHRDSGMHGWPTNTAEGALWVADADAVARQVADVLDDEDADAVIGYDWHGGYGHPDHLMVHRVARHAVELAARRPRYLEVSLNRDLLRRLMTVAREQGLLPEEGTWDVDAPADDGNPIGTPEAELHWAVDVTGQLDVKRAALACHASQEDAAQLLSMPPEAFAAMMGTEHFLEPGRAPGLVTGWPFA
ncbi:PIG-L deacetylase family protein [Propioniciclava soli]|uniref:PIG-L deacetylase family protein n=1 Tax=Propioniciclava soli TaxID=2775081 RepID=UPI001E2C85E4|nr:PIG-L family deacetylase [Propioniciclava soli]